MGFIIYGSVGEVSIGRLFVGGIIPGLLMMAMMMFTVNFTAKRRGYVARKDVRKPNAREVVSALWENIFALIFPVILIVGIRFGSSHPRRRGPSPRGTPFSSGSSSTGR